MARVIEDARRFGMDGQSLANLRLALDAPAAIDGEEFDGIWPENAPTAEAFYAVCTQWRVVPIGGSGFASAFGGSVAPTTPFFVGLDYTAARTGLDAEGFDVTPELWRGLRVMENAACAVLNKAD
jgi:hypothetical protein